MHSYQYTIYVLTQNVNRAQKYKIETLIPALQSRSCSLFSVHDQSQLTFPILYLILTCFVYYKIKTAIILTNGIKNQNM